MRPLPRRCVRCPMRGFGASGPNGVGRGWPLPARRAGDTNALLQLSVFVDEPPAWQNLHPTQDKHLETPGGIRHNACRYQRTHMRGFGASGPNGVGRGWPLPARRVGDTNTPALANPRPTRPARRAGATNSMQTQTPGTSQGAGRLRTAKPSTCPGARSSTPRPWTKRE